jgi:hypothetical protein
MTHPLNVPQQLPGRESMRTQNAIGKLAKQLSTGQAADALGLRLGVVQSVAYTPGNPVSYQVDVGGTVVTAETLSTVGAIQFDTVMVLKQGPNWTIVALAGASSVVKSFQPILTAGTTNPTLSASEGLWRMLGPTSMWISYNMTIATAGSGSYSVSGCPLPVAYDQTINGLWSGASGNQRFSAAGYFNQSGDPTQIVRVGVAGTPSTGVGSTGPPGPIPAGAKMQLCGVLEVDPSNL